MIQRKTDRQTDKEMGEGEGGREKIGKGALKYKPKQIEENNTVVIGVSGRSTVGACGN